LKKLKAYEAEDSSAKSKAWKKFLDKWNSLDDDIVL
jgi:hypothetical protein